MSTMLATLIDISGLESFLDGLRNRIDGLQDRIAEVESDHESIDEDAVQSLIDSAIDNADFLTESNAYDAISSQVYDMVKDVVREDLDEKDFAGEDHDHDYSYAAADDLDELKERVQGLEEQGVANTSDRVDDLEAKVKSLQEKVGALEAAVDQRDNIIGSLATNLEALQAQVTSLQNQTQDAITLFGLLRRAAEILRGAL